MYAIISDGAHQYRVEVGQVLEVHLKDIPADAETVDFERVLAVGDLDEEAKIGRPTVAGAKVSASVLGECKGSTIGPSRKTCYGTMLNGQCTGPMF